MQSTAYGHTPYNGKATQHMTKHHITTHYYIIWVVFVCWCLLIRSCVCWVCLRYYGAYDFDKSLLDALAHLILIFPFLRSLKFLDLTIVFHSSIEFFFFFQQILGHKNEIEVYISIFFIILMTNCNVYCESM